MVLFVQHRVVFGNNAELRHGKAHPERLTILTGAQAALGEAVVVKNNAELGFYLFAPYADIELQNNGDLDGGIVGKKLRMVEQHQGSTAGGRAAMRGKAMGSHASRSEGSGVTGWNGSSCQFAGRRLTRRRGDDPQRPIGGG